MKRAVVTVSVIAAAFMVAGFANTGHWLPALCCIGWEVFVLLVNTIKKPRAATRGKEDVVPMRPLYTYDNTLRVWRQDPDQRWRA